MKVITESELQERFKMFAINVYHLTKLLPRKPVYSKIEDQLSRSSSSATANYRSACKGKSLSDFINKLCIVEEETDESVSWVEYTNGIDKKWESQTIPLINEGNELLSIIVASI